MARHLSSLIYCIVSSTNYSNARSPDVGLSVLPGALHIWLLIVQGYRSRRLVSTGWPPRSIRMWPISVSKSREKIVENKAPSTGTMTPKLKLKEMPGLLSVARFQARIKGCLIQVVDGLWWYPLDLHIEGPCAETPSNCDVKYLGV